MILSRAALDALQVSRKCWSRQQFILLGVPFPPEKGWIKRMEGKFITDDTHQRLVDLAKGTKKPRRVRPGLVNYEDVTGV